MQTKTANMLKVTLNTEHLDIFFTRLDDYAGRKLQDEELLEILKGHPHAKHVAAKYRNADNDFTYFIKTCDPIVAGLFFPELTEELGPRWLWLDLYRNQPHLTAGLPPAYLDFLRWFKFADDFATWTDKTDEEKDAILENALAEGGIYSI